MSGIRGKSGLRRRLFCVMLVVVLLHVVILFFMGSALFERFYLSSKVQEMEESAKNHCFPL